MITNEIKKLKEILDVVLGEPKQELGESMQLEYPCPCCIEKYGMQEARKYNLSVSLSKQRMQCWKCSSEGDSMHGSIVKLIKQYGTPELLQQYKDTIRSIRESELYKLNFKDSDFNIDTSIIEREELKFPESFKFLDRRDKRSIKALDYLEQRGIGWDIISKYRIGYTSFQNENKKPSYRIIIPSYDAYGELNYWVGRNYLPLDRVKYDNPKVEKRGIIFNEEKVRWDADITLVEGPFDHLVVPNSIPLLGKALNQSYKLYWDLISKFNGNSINVFLDADAKSTMLEIYKFLNHGRLYNKIRYIPVEGDEDPSSLYQKGGYKEIAYHLRNAEQINEVFLI